MGCSPVWTRDELDRLRVEHGWLIATIDGRGPVLYGAGAVPSGVAYQRGLAMCRMNGTVQRCLEVNPQYQTSFAFKRLGDSVLPADSAKLPWERLEEFVVADSGEISRLRVR